MDSAIVSAIIAAIAALAATWLAHYLQTRQKRQDSPNKVGGATNEEVMSIREATQRLAEKAAKIGLPLGEVRQSSASAFGTVAYCVQGRDGKGALYCHASGSQKGSVYHVRGGIGSYYLKLKGPASFLGLPLSDEEPVAEGQRSVFEGGIIVWKSISDALDVYDTRVPGIARLIRTVPLKRRSAG